MTEAVDEVSGVLLHTNTLNSEPLAEEDTPASKDTSNTTTRSDIVSFASFKNEPIKLSGGHGKAISALGTDMAGLRMFTAGYDHYLKHWDRGMVFREDEEPFGSYPLRTISFSRNGGKVLVVPRSPQPAVMTREGRILFEYSRGDPYLLDKRKTTGHSGPMCGGQWHPSIADYFITGSSDGTIRIWDVPTKSCASVIMTGPRNQVSAVVWSPDGSSVLSGSSAGAFQIWVNNRKQASLSVSPHLITSIAVTKEKNIVAVRSMNSSLSLLDLRNLKTPIATAFELPTAYEEIDVVLSPDGKFLITGTSELRGGDGTLLAFCPKTLQKKGTCIDCHLIIDIASSGIVRVHSDPHQLIVGQADGTVVAFSDEISYQKYLSAPVKKSNVFESADLAYADIDINAGVYAPETDELFNDDFIDLGPILTRKRPDPVATKRPELPPISGPGWGGKIGSSAAQHVLRHIVPESKDVDPREAVLKYAKIAEEDPKFVTPAYKKTQPKSIFSKAPKQ